MVFCECGRKFTTPQGLGRHKKFCGRYDIFYDNDYPCRINENGQMVYLHREVMEKKLGRKLLPNEIIHHKDENKLNYSENNLELTNSIKHVSLHRNSFRPNIQARGSRISKKLTEVDVLNIKYLLSTGVKVREIMKIYNIGQSTIYDIKSKSTWNHI